MSSWTPILRHCVALPNLKFFLFSKCQNMVKNEKVLLDPNSEALTPCLNEKIDSGNTHLQDLAR